MIRSAIKQAIKLRRLKQSELAERIGVTPSTMSRFLSGGINFTQENIEKLLAITGVRLVIDEDEKKRL